MKCLVCDAAELDRLPNPSDRNAILTDGTILPGKLFDKYECRVCGLVQSKSVSDVLDAHDYAADYDLHNRPTSAAYEAARFDSYAKVAKDILKPGCESFLEIGCGYGGFLKSMAKLGGCSEYVGLEPSNAAIAAADQRLRIVHSAFPADLGTQFDVIYHMHVFEHVSDPAGFADGLLKALRPDGQAIFVVPAAEQIFNEVLFLDHLWGWSASNLSYFLEKRGFEIVRSFHTFEQTNGEHVNWLVARAATKAGSPAVPQVGEKDFDRRKAYLEQWRSLDERLAHSLPAEGKIVLFGASEWALLLRALAPTVWERVSVITVDGCEEGAFLGKPLVPFEKISQAETGARYLLAVKPASVAGLTRRLRQLGLETVGWHHLVGEQAAQPH